MHQMAALSLLLMVAFSSPAFGEEACRKETYLDTDYVVCTFDPAKSTIRIYNKNSAGLPYGSFVSLAGDIWHTGKNFLRFAVNGGMYHYDLSPVGLFIENGIEKVSVNTNGGWGNFHLLPNGIFYVEDKSAGVMETQAYLHSGIKPRYATQSGPMLVIDGKIHPAFLPQSDSFKVRNGVGIDAEGRAIFVNSEETVRFYDLALFYRDVLNCRNALFLDGSISSLAIPEWGRFDNHDPMGPIIAVTGSLP